MARPPDTFRLSLAWKVTLAFGFVVLAALLAFSILANRTAAREVRGFMFSGGVTDNALLAEDLAAYYRLHGSWQGVAPVLTDASPWRRMMRYIARWLPPARICHPYPLVRLGVVTQGKSRMR